MAGAETGTIPLCNRSAAAVSNRAPGINSDLSVALCQMSTRGSGLFPCHGVASLSPRQGLVVSDRRSSGSTDPNLIYILERSQGQMLLVPILQAFPVREAMTLCLTL